MGATMEKFQTVLLKVWREACRHIDVDESVQTITPMLLQDIPIEQLVVLRIDAERSCLETVAVGLPGPDHTQPSLRTECTKSQLRKLATWCKQNEVVHLDRHTASTGPWRVATGTDLNHDALIGPLQEANGLRCVLVLTARGRCSFSARHVALMQALLEPFSVALSNDHQIRELAMLREAAESEKRHLLTRLGRTKDEDTIVGAESGLSAVMQRVELVASSDVPALIFGETGSGKELIARAIHHRSPRASNSIYRVNCGAIPIDLVDSELFGHERGAFTGAVESRKGWFERADKGTLFLDEIGELPLAAQVRLLRILQDGWLERVGGRHPIQVDVRIVAATHRDLAEMVASGKFRQDLWYRISVFPIVLPALRERTEDIGELARHFADRAATRFGLPLAQPTQDDIELLGGYPWPGNVRELAAVIDRAAILGEGRDLEIAKALGFTTAIPSGRATSERMPTTATHTPSGIEPLDVIVKRHIESALQDTRGRIEGPYGAANVLQINPHTLRARMRKLGIDWRRYRQG